MNLLEQISICKELTLKMPKMKDKIKHKVIPTAIRTVGKIDETSSSSSKNCLLNDQELNTTCLLDNDNNSINSMETSDEYQ